MHGRKCTPKPQPNLQQCIYQTTRTGGEISHKEYGYREVREADDIRQEKEHQPQTSVTVEQRQRG